MTTLEWKLGYRFINQNLLTRALTHKSFHNENKELSLGNNERLEFLGDSVLALVLSEALMRLYPDVSEGDLSRVRASLVNEQTLADIAVSELELDELLVLGKGERTSGGKSKPRLQCSVLEAVIGAVFIDGQFEAAKNVVLKLFAKTLKSVDIQVQYQADFKTRLQEVVQERYKTTPTYTVIKEEGPDHDKVFIVEVKYNEEILAQGQGNSKKQASQEAARLALEGL